MVLITGGNGFLGKLVQEEIKKKNIKKLIFFTKHSSAFSIKNNIININLSSKNHLARLFKAKKIKKIIHLAVTRNNINNPKIRSFNTLSQDIKILISLLENSSNLNKILYLSSAAVYKNVINKNNKNDIVKAKLVIEKIINFIVTNSNNKKLYKESIISENKLLDQSINPCNHKEDNLRLNGISKFISEIILREYCYENKVSLEIIRPYRMVK